MNSRFLRETARLACLAALAAGPPTLSAHAADGPLERARLRVEVGAEVWRLRPTLPPAARKGQATEIPEARRSVRMVYPALVETR